MDSHDYAIGDVVYIEWVDSVGSAGWQPSVQPECNMEAMTVGFLVAEFPDRYIVACSLAPNGDCYAPLHIPKVAVQLIVGVSLPATDPQQASQPTPPRRRRS